MFPPPASTESCSRRRPTLGYMGYMRYMGYMEYRHVTSALCNSSCGQLTNKIRNILWRSSSRSSKQAASLQTNCLQPVRTQAFVCQVLKKGVAVHFERNDAYNAYNGQFSLHLLTAICYHWWPAEQRANQLVITYPHDRQNCLEMRI